MLADCSNGMEPNFALVFEKRVTVGRFFYTNKIFEEVLKENNLYSEELLAKIADNYGSVKGLSEVPDWIQNIFVTAMDIHWSDHLLAQAVWQDWIANAIAKTINMPNDVTADDVKASYLLAHEMGLKGITVYRDGSRHKQVLHMASEDSVKTFDVTPSDYLVSYISNNIKNDYVKSQINNANLSFGNFILGNFNNSNLFSSNMQYANCNNTNFDNANLAKVNFEGANLFMASFKGANLFEANLTGANITNAVFDEANLSNAIWVDGKKCALGSVGSCD